MSEVDPTIFPDNQKVAKRNLRGQLTIIKDEITELEQSVATPRKMAFTDANDSFTLPQLPSDLSAFLSLATGTTVPRTFANRWLLPFNGADYGIKCDGVTDDTAAAQRALNAVGALGGGYVVLPPGVFVVSDTLIEPNATHLRGQGDVNPSHNGTAPTRFKWIGGAKPMIKCGRQGIGELYYGGGVSNMIFENFSGLATYCLDIRDLQHAVFENLSFRFAATSHIYISNTTNAGAQEPTSGLIFRNMFIGGAGAAHGIEFDGKFAGGTEGVTNISIYDTLILHENGDGLRAGRSNDGVKLYNVFCYGYGTGFSGHWVSLVTTQSSGFWNFYSCFLRTGLKLDHAVAGLGSQIFANGDSSDGLISPTLMVQGPGSPNVTQFSSYNGKMFGSVRVHGFRDAPHADSMSYINYVAANNMLHTACGNWLTVVDAAGNITDSAVTGGATSLVTGNVNGNTTSIKDAAFGSGVSTNDAPQMMFGMFNVAPLTNQKVRAGLFNDVTDAPNNAIYVEAWQDNSAFFNLVTASAGVRTTTVTAIAVAVTANMFRIEIGGGFVNFWIRPAGSELWTWLVTHTTNIPTSAFPLSHGFWIKTTAGVFRQVAITDFRRAFNTEH